MCHPDAIAMKDLSPGILDELNAEFKKHENENPSIYATKIDDFLKTISKRDNLSEKDRKILKAFAENHNDVNKKFFWFTFIVWSIKIVVAIVKAATK